MKKAFFFLLGLLFLCGFSVSSDAEIYTIHFSGTVQSVGSELTGGGIVPGDPVAGQFSYDTALPDLAPDDNYGWYQPSPDQPFSVSMGSGFSAISSNSNIHIENDPSSFSSNSMGISTWTIDSADTLNGRAVERFSFSMFKNASDGDFLPDDSLPTAADLQSLMTDPSLYYLAGMSFQCGPSGCPSDINDRVVRWDISSFRYEEANHIPEPSTLLLLACGLLGLVGYGKIRIETTRSTRISQ
jgi:hypothetical protein